LPRSPIGKPVSALSATPGLRSQAVDADRSRWAGGFERDLICARTTEGRARAKACGVKLGRKPKLTDHQKREAIRRRDHDGETVREIARSYNVSHSTISR
jgi:Helix-turn-helix domain